MNDRGREKGGGTIPLDHVQGVDHVVVAVRDLDEAAARWRQLGFTLSPRGTHPPLLGTANHTIMFGEDYLELSGVLAPTELNASLRDFLARREGIHRTAFATDDAAAGIAELRRRGIEATGPIDFGRPVELPGGGVGQARFSVFRLPPAEAPGGMGIFAAQHHTPGVVWLPELQDHANGARRIVRIDIVAPDPKAAAAHMARLIDRPCAETADGWQVASGTGRADFLFCDAAGFARRYPKAVREGAAGAGAAAVTLETGDMTRAITGCGGEGVRHEDMLSVPARLANGVVVSFV